MLISKIKINSSKFIKVIIITLIFSLVNINSEKLVLGEINTDEEAVTFVQNIFKVKSKAVLSKDLDLIEALYATDTKYGQWAYEYEQKKVKYINNWAEKQGVEFIDIIPNAIIKKSKIKEDKCSFSILCNTEYKYIYPDQPERVNSSKIGTYHSTSINQEK